MVWDAELEVLLITADLEVEVVVAVDEAASVVDRGEELETKNTMKDSWKLTHACNDWNCMNAGAENEDGCSEAEYEGIHEEPRRKKQQLQQRKGREMREVSPGRNPDPNCSPSAPNYCSSSYHITPMMHFWTDSSLPTA